MTLTLAELTEKTNQTVIRIAIDLSKVQRIEAGQSFTFAADGETEVYVVSRWAKDTTVYALSISGDTLKISVEPLSFQP